MRIPRIIDLTYPFDDRTIYWSQKEKFARTQLAFGRNEAGLWIANFSFAAGEHGGTHMDAPLHFAEAKRSIADIPIGQHIGAGVKISIADQCSRDRDYRLQASDLLSWEAVAGPIPKGAILLIHTGWGRYWGDRAGYLGSASAEDTAVFHFPGIGRDAAELLSRGRQIAMVGIDTASLDHGPSSDFPAHQILCAAEIPGVENVANLEQLPESGFLVLALPMKIAGGSGAPTRIVALFES